MNAIIKEIMMDSLLEPLARIGGGGAFITGARLDGGALAADKAKSGVTGML